MVKRKPWSEEQKQAARIRMAHARKAIQPKLVPTVEAQDSPVAVLEPIVKERDPEVQAILDSMTPERRAKLAQIQAKTLATKEAQDAIIRHQAEKATGTSEAPFAVVSEEPRRVGSREISLIVRTDGTMVSQFGPCLCGAGKREWHPICLKQSNEG